MNIVYTILDDRSPEITYMGTWTQGETLGKEFNGTTTWTSSAGSSANITFNGQCDHIDLSRFHS